jgi:hypothetical protein
MRQLAILAAVFATGLFLGHEFWPPSHPDPTHHLRFHRGKMPRFDHPSPTPPPKQHGRIIPPATP